MFPSSLENNINHKTYGLYALRGTFLRNIFSSQQDATMRYILCMGSVAFSPAEVAEKLGVGVETVRRYLRSGKLRGVHLSVKCWRVPASELYLFIRNCK
jgi:excisionase family DNA binding protein